MKKLFQSLHLNEIGLFELLVALYPIISQYEWGALHMNFVWLLILDVIAILKGTSVKWFKPLTVLLFFYAIHELVVFIGFTRMPMYMIGDVLSSLIIAASIPIVASAVNFNKLVGSFQWVAIVCLGGMVYHYVLIISGSIGSVHPLTLPFFPAQDLSSRAFENIGRPTSFFWEPSSYATFMIIPMFLCLTERSFLVAIVYALSVFLSSSTNGIIFTVVLFLMFVLSGGNFRTNQKVLTAIVLVGLGYVLFNSELFTQGVDKMENTEISGNQRISNGYNLLRATPGIYLVTGADAANVNDFLVKHPEIDKTKLTFLGTGNLFVSDFWRIWIKYGIFGLVLVLWMYLATYRRCKALRPYIVVLLIAFFSQSVVFGSIWGYQWIFMLGYMNYERTS